MSRTKLALAWGLLPAAVSPALASPKIGDKAPAIRAAKWITQKPPAMPGQAGGEQHVFVVEFWATWCRPCLRSIPHLAELHKKHERDGLVIISISNEEPEIIQAFIKTKMKMPYFVGSDDDMKTSTAWADDIQTIPHAFIVDRSGAVVWSGNPLADRAVMDEVISKVLTGKFDVEAAKNVAATEEKFKKLTTELQKAFTVGNEAKLFETVDGMIALRPLELKSHLIKRNLLVQFGRTKELPDFDARLEQTFRDSASALQQLIQFEHGKDLAERNAGLLYRCAVRLNELTEGRDADTLAVLARIQCEFGRVDAAIETQQRALDLAPEAVVEQYKKTLDYYKAVKEVGERHSPDSTVQAGPQ